MYNTNTKVKYLYFSTNTEREEILEILHGTQKLSCANRQTSIAQFLGIYEYRQDFGKDLCKPEKNRSNLP